MLRTHGQDQARHAHSLPHEHVAPTCAYTSSGFVPKRAGTYALAHARAIEVCLRCTLHAPGGAPPPHSQVYVLAELRTQLCAATAQVLNLATFIEPPLTVHSRLAARRWAGKGTCELLHSSGALKAQGAPVATAGFLSAVLIARNAVSFHYGDPQQGCSRPGRGSELMERIQSSCQAVSDHHCGARLARKLGTICASTSGSQAAKRGVNDILLGEASGVVRQDVSSPWPDAAGTRPEGDQSEVMTGAWMRISRPRQD